MNLDSKNTLSNVELSENSLIFQTLLKFSVISTLLGMCYYILLYLVDKHFSMLGMIALVFPCIIVFVAINEYRKERQKTVTFGRAFLIGILFFTICGILAWGFTLLYTNVIIPDYWDGLTEYLETIYENFGMSDDQIQMALDKTTQNRNNYMLQLLYSVATYLIIGAIFSAIAAAVLKSDNKNATV
jgi:hypothetical protein